MQRITPYIISSLLLLSITISGQNSYFNKMLDYNKEHHFSPQIENIGEDLYTLVTVIDSSKKSSSIYLQSNKSNGDRSWLKRFHRIGKWYNTERTLNVKDSTIYFVLQNTPRSPAISNEVTIYKISNKGVKVDSYQVLLTDSVRIYNSNLLEDGTFINTGYRYKNKDDWYWFINRVDTNGNELFYNEYEWVGRNIGYTVDLAPDGGYVMGGKSIGYNLDSLDQSTIIKTDSVGNIEWIRDFGDRWVDNTAYTTVTKSGRIIGSMQLNVEGDNNFPWDGLRKNQIICLDLNGNVIWKKFIGKTDEIYPTNARYPKQLTDGSIVVYSSERDFYAGRAGYIHKFSPNSGDSIFSRYYRYLKNTWTDHYLRDVAELPNGNLALAGFFDPFGDTAVGTSANRMWILGVDSLGCLFPGCDTVCKKFDLEYEITYDSGYTYNVEIKDPVVNSYALIYKDDYNNIIDNSYKLNFSVTFPGQGEYTFELYGENECIISSSADTTIMVEEPSGKNASRQSTKIKVYPNPASDFIKVSLPKNQHTNHTYRLTSMAGKAIQSGVLEAGNTISLPGISGGVYLLEVYDGKGVLIFRKKVVKE